MEEAQRYVQRKTISERKGSHPWLDGKCLDAIRNKHHCQGIEHFEAAARACTDAISSAHRKFIETKKAELKHGSKQWWSIAKTLLDGATKMSGIPSVKNSDGHWIHEAKEKQMHSHMCYRRNLFYQPICIQKFLSHAPRRRK